ncbi:MAG: endolytic transglycosylase MltG [Anaerolineae bacterium]
MSVILSAFRFVFRLILFTIALAAIVVILGGGVWYFQQTVLAGGDEATRISVDTGRSAILRPPEGIEDYLISLYLQSRAADLNTPLAEDATPVAFTIEAGEPAATVASRLYEMGLIADPDLFRRFLSYNRLDALLEAGDFELRRNMTMWEVAEALQKAQFQEVIITIPEGKRAEEVAELLSEQGIMDGAAFLEVVRQGQAVEHSLLFDRPTDRSYEGYLFPDTYRLPAQAAPEDLISRMLDNLASKLPANAIELASRQGLSFYQVLTIAAIVEREAALPAERPLIASVYLNRIEQGMYLQADPTVQYAMGYQADTGQWWKTPVTLEEYSSVVSPFNTYLNPGLPPGPIASPGIDSILAVLQPEDTEYLFFMGCGGEGAHLFSVTYEEHQQNVAACQGG